MVSTESGTDAAVQVERVGRLPNEPTEQVSFFRGAPYPNEILIVRWPATLLERPVTRILVE